MSEWSKVCLGELIKVKHGFAFPGQFITSEMTDRILVTPGNFCIGGGFKQGKFKYFSSHDYPAEYQFLGGELIVTMTDLSKETDTLGYSAVVPSDGKVYLHNQRVGLIEPISAQSCLEFVYWLMRWRDYQVFIVNSASGTSVMHTSPSRICEFEFELPPLPEQKAIASVLSSLDDKIDLLHRQNKTLEAMAETLFRQWFIEEAKEDWEKVTLGDIVNITSSKRIFYSEYVDEGIPFYRSKEIIELNKSGQTRSELFISNERFDGIVAKFGAPVEGDILLTSVGTLGVTYQVKASDRFYFKDGNLTWFKDFKHISSNIIFCWLNSKNGKEQLDNISIGSTQAALTIQGLKSLELSLPSLNVIQKLDEQLVVIYQKVNANQSQIQTLEKLRDTLLPKLMSGEVRVQYQTAEVA